MTKSKKDELELTRHNLSVLSIVDVVDDSRLNGSDRKNYLAYAHELMLNPVFQNICKLISLKQRDMTICDAETDVQLADGRGTINGVSLVYEAVLALNSEFESARRNAPEFDEQNSLPEI